MAAARFRARPTRLAWMLWGFWSAATAPALALDPAQPIDRYVHRAWTTDEGLPQNSVYAMVQTRDGYLWLGTDEGLARFDGLQFTIFDRTNTPEISDPFFFALHEGADGSLWAGSDRGGLLRYRDGHFARYGTEHGLPPARVQAIASDPQGTLWVGLRGAGLARLIGDRLTTFGTRDGLSSDNVLSVLVDSSQTVWVGTDAGLDRFDAGHFVHVSSRDGLPAGGVRAIYEDHAHRLWIGMLAGPLGARFREGALCVKNGSRFLLVSATADLPSIAVMTMLEDRDGNLWLGTAGGGIVRFHNGRFESWLLSESPSDDMVYALTEDREGSLWIGTQPGGLHRLQDSRFVTYGEREGLHDEVIESLYEDSHGVMWIGTHAGGVCKAESSGLRCLTTANGLAHDRVNAIIEDPADTFWLGTEGGLNRIQGARTDRYTVREGLPVDHINALLPDRDGSLWIGTWGGGLARLRNGRIERPAGTIGRYVNILWQRHSGEIWIGTTDGLSIWRDEHVLDATKDLGMPSAVEAIHEDDHGYVWLGTRRDGLFLYKDGRLTQFTTRSGLYDNLVGTILEDRGYLWITCNKGIFRVPRKELLEVAAGTRSSVTARVFDTSDGMKNRECDFGQGRWRARDGRLWFATIGGVAVIDPARLASNIEPARVHIEEMMMDGGVLPLDPPPSVPYGKRHVEFRFVGLSFSAPSRVRYRYRLEGFDPDWIDGRDQRTAHYTNIPPGSYRFRVTASNGDGLWSADGAVLGFSVASPLWRRPWFAPAIAGLAVATILLVGQVRVARLKRAQAAQTAFSRQLISSQENERRRLAGELHDGIGQQLLIIGNWARLASAANTSPDETRSSLEVITQTAAVSMREIRALTHGLQPYDIEHVGLREALDAMLRRMGEASGVEFATDIADVEDALPTDSGINLYRIVQEAANNIVKHAQATEARVTIRRRPHTLEVTVADNGRGLRHEVVDGSKREGGFGLRSLDARTRLLGGRHRIESKPGGGTTLIVEIPTDALRGTHVS